KTTDDRENGLPSRSVEAGRRKCNDLCLQETAQLPSSNEVQKTGHARSSSNAQFEDSQKTGHARHPSAALFRRFTENWARKELLNCPVLTRSEKLGTQDTPQLPSSDEIQKTGHARSSSN